MSLVNCKTYVCFYCYSESAVFFSLQYSESTFRKSTAILTVKNNMIRWSDTQEFIHAYQTGWRSFCVFEIPNDSDLRKKYAYFS